MRCRRASSSSTSSSGTASPSGRSRFEERRRRVEALPFDVSPASDDPKQGQAWLDRLEVAGFDGVIAKRLDQPYRPGSREAVRKVKREQTADCVVLGLRWKARPTNVATLLLGLYDNGDLRYVGSAAVAAKRNDEFLEHPPAATRGRARPPLLGAEPLGHGRPRGVGRPPRARRRGPLRQVAEGEVSTRHALPALAAGQGARRVHRRRRCGPRPKKGDPTVPALLGKD